MILYEFLNGVSLIKKNHLVLKDLKSLFKFEPHPDILIKLNETRCPRPTVLISLYVTFDAEVTKQIFRLGVQPDALSPPVFSSPASLVLIYQPTH
ncbi:hypothetical protein TNCV_411801 [Trichonephila clavipes]|nr:hypothetical protein TNCV_411801 [Trichonephila clavipes]